MKSKRERLIALYKKAKSDDLPLKKKANKLVFGAGNPQAKILFIGEGPGYWEDVKGIPFVGNAGKLLDQVLSEVGIKREKVFITNVVMYRPPENRDPTDDEINAFKPYLDKIISIIKPQIICTLGRFSMAKFLPGVMISKVHGKPTQVNWGKRKVTVVPMYHPAAALRNGEIKNKFRKDFTILPGLLEKKEEVESEKKDDSIKKLDQMSLV